jgi:CDP-glucose 4,6-dehydratase
VLIRQPGAIRPWQHVLDPLQGYIVLAERLLAGHGRLASSFNFGPVDHGIWPVERIANRLAERWGQGASWTRDPSSNPHESRILRLDSSRARIELTWRPRLSTEAALDWTLDWYRAQRDGADMRQLSLAQIHAFEQLDC